MQPAQVVRLLPGRARETSEPLETIFDDPDALVFLDDHEIECPLHQGRFDVLTGNAPCEALANEIRTYELRIEEGDGFVQV
ncbi:MAG TPA: hypothetical protein VFE81_16055 [Paraburkholderia sp.]|nr:hypothetical protein [Paraburkholderia sp.]HZZ04413.1 hypothetical protein [Paraburkholderia sp.]